MDVTIRSDGHIVRCLHQCDFGGRLVHATAACDVLAGNNIKLRCSFLHTVNDESAAQFLLRRSLPLLQSPVREDACDQVERAFVLVPGPDVFTKSHALANGGFLEIGCDKGNITLGRNYSSGKPLRTPPAYASEVNQCAEPASSNRASIPACRISRCAFSITGQSFINADRHSVAQSYRQDHPGVGPLAAENTGLDTAARPAAPDSFRKSLLFIAYLVIRSNNRVQPGC